MRVRPNALILSLPTVGLFACLGCSEDLERECDYSGECTDLDRDYTLLDDSLDPTVYDCGEVTVVRQVDKDNTYYRYFDTDTRKIIGIAYPYHSSTCAVLAYGTLPDPSWCKKDAHGDRTCLCDDAEIVYPL